jgi:nicotinate-nucleotide adenylyltransferase
VRLGVFGGTFDPPHIGHLIVARDVLERLGLARVLFVPALEPPHKRGRSISPAGVRLEMLQAAVSRHPGFAVDDLELRRSGPSYTVDTLLALRERHADDELFLLLGADQYADLDSWHRPEEIRRLARIVVLARGGDAPGGDVLSVPVTRIDISSTGVRSRVADGRSIRWLVPEAVEHLIRHHHLYDNVVAGASGGEPA